MASIAAREAYKIRNPDRVAQTMREAQARYRSRVFDILGRVCVRCGFADIRALQIDHIDGGGHRLRDKERSQNGLLKAVMADSLRFQVLCANCNCIKRIENGEHRRVAP